ATDIIGHGSELFRQFEVRPQAKKRIGSITLGQLDLTQILQFERRRSLDRSDCDLGREGFTGPYFSGTNLGFNTCRMADVRAGNGHLTDYRIDAKENGASVQRNSETQSGGNTMPGPVRLLNQVAKQERELPRGDDVVEHKVDCV